MDQSIAHTRALEWHAGALPMMLLTALVVVLYWPSATALHEVWWHSDRGVYSQGYLIAAASVWILAMRSREAGASLRPNPWAVPLVLVLGFLWPAWFVTTKLDVNKAQAGVQQVLTDETNGYGAKNVKDVNCNGGSNPTVKKGGTFDCTVSIDGALKHVTVTFQDSKGTYEVGRPQ